VKLTVGAAAAPRTIGCRTRFTAIASQVNVRTMRIPKYSFTMSVSTKVSGNARIPAVATNVSPSRPRWRGRRPNSVNSHSFAPRKLAVTKKPTNSARLAKRRLSRFEPTRDGLMRKVYSDSARRRTGRPESERSTSSSVPTFVA